jgi:hypothetical protein
MQMDDCKVLKLKPQQSNCTVKNLKHNNQVGKLV